MGEELIFKTEPNGCIRCESMPFHRAGYYLYRKAGMVLHRFLYEQNVGEIPPQSYVSLMCGNKWCANTDHMKITTPSDRQTTHFSFDNISYSEDENGCWICTSHPPQKYGYPRVQNGKWAGNLHRWVYMQLYGKLPSDVVVRHLCNNKMCINPDHLAAGSAKDNTHDTVLAGGFHPVVGDNHLFHKLTNKLVAEIRSSNITSKEWANKLGVSYFTVQKARAGITWKHIPMP